MTHPTKPNDEFATFITTLRDELMAMPDEEVLEGTDIEQLRSRRARILEAAKKEAGRRRMTAAKAKLQTSKEDAVAAGELRVDPAEARRYITQVANDERYTLAARKLGEGLSDDEAVRLYQQIRSLERGSVGPGEKS